MVLPVYPIGKACYSLSRPPVFVGLLWPGDSVWAHGLDYPEEPRIANDAGSSLIAPFLDANCGNTASISFASRSASELVLFWRRFPKWPSLSGEPR